LAAQQFDLLGAMRSHPNDDRKPAGNAGGFSRDRAGGNAAPLWSLVLRRWLLVLATIGGALVAGGAGAAQAQLRVDGQPDAVRVEVNDVPLQEVLAALGAKFNLRYRTDDALETRKTGIFDGPLQRVTARILDGYDFAMKITPQGIDVLVLRQHQADGKAVAAAMPAATPPKGSPAPVMTASQANRYEREHFR
jgi:hypothetical protein